MSEGMDIPIGADFSAFEAAMQRLSESMDKLGSSISSSFERANSSISAAVAKMSALNTGAAATAATQQKAAAAASTTSAKFIAVGKAAMGMAHTIGALGASLGHVSSIMQVLGSNNFGTMLTNLTRIGSGLKNAMKSVWSALQQLGTSNSFWKIAAGAAVAVTGVLAVRTAFRIVTGSVRLLGSSVSGVFRGMVSAAHRAAASIGNAFKSVGSLPGKMLGGGLPLAGIIGSLASVAGMVGFSMKSIGEAADIESLETSFAPLLGGVDKAKERLRDLSAFARDTPFDLPETARASRVLEVLTRGALSTSKGLTLVGDVAAATGAPFEELAMWIGRLYDGLNSGRPVGEALMRLQELGVVSGDVRNRLEALQKSGAAGGDMWDEAAAGLARFSGSMLLQSETWNGKISNLKASIDAAMAAFGKPIIDGIKPFVDLAIKRIDELKATAEKVGAAIRMAFDGALAAWQTESIAGVLLDGLELAMISGINTFMAGLQGGMAFLSAAMGRILGSIGDGLMKSGILGVFGNLANAMGSTIAAAVLSSIGKITGFVGWEKDAEKERKQAGFSMDLAKYGMENLDLAGGFKTMTSGLKQAVKEGREAYQAGKGDPFLDDKNASQSYVERIAGVRAQVEKNIAARAEYMKRLESGAIKSQEQKKEGLQDIVSRAALPAVMSLTRVGGGGQGPFGDGLFAEARRQTSVLKQIAKNTNPTGFIDPRFGARYTARYS